MAIAPTASEKPRILFSSYHCYLDTSSGAALSVRDLFALLAGRGWDCRVFSGPDLDFAQERGIEDFLAGLQIPAIVQHGNIGPLTAQWFHLEQNHIPVTLFAPSSPRRPEPSRADGFLFLALLEQTFEQFRPDVLLTYGGHWLARETMAAARRRGIPVAFWLRNYAYRETDLFRAVQSVIVPSRFTRDHYRDTLKLECTPISSPLDWARLECEEVRGKHVTFVNPEPHKGVYWFAGIVRALTARRPEIPFLVVEGRGKAPWLERTGLDPRVYANLFVLENTPDARDFLSTSRLILMPSLWSETFGRVAAEAMLNGIPVLASSRGALPETLAGAGFVLEIPAKYTPESTIVPTPEEVAPWVDTIIRLCDDADFYAQEQVRCRSVAEAWRPDRLAAAYEEVFMSLMSGKNAKGARAS